MKKPQESLAHEKRWQKLWLEHDVYKTPEKPKKGVYVLDMFPYPSGAGLHVGHPEGYTASDIYARYLRHTGKDVLHPMGFDSFGLPAENYAIKTGTHPSITTKENIENMRRQIKSLGFSYDWNREIITSNPAYYKWTQWIFIKLFEAGLAYEADAPINWCPSCKTGLANEEVVSGKCERCDTTVTKKNIKQWLVKITDEKYIDRLLHDLDDLDWPENIKDMQRNWIGRSEGAEVDFEVKDYKEKITVFTTRPDTLFGATYMVLSPEHELVNKITTDAQHKEVHAYQEKAAAKSDLERTELQKEKTGVFTGAFAINPVNKKEIPIWIADYVLASYGTGAIMAVPAHDERDFEFVNRVIRKEDPDHVIVAVVDPTEDFSNSKYINDNYIYDLLGSTKPLENIWSDIRKSIIQGQIPYSGGGVAINSEEFNGLKTEEFKKKIIGWSTSKKDKEKSTCLIVHGLSGHKHENWFPWLKEELDKDGWDTIVPTMPGAGHPTRDSWDDYLSQYDKQINEDSVLVGHSLGCASILYHLQKTGKKVGTIILVAPTNPLQDWTKLKNNFPQADWDAVKSMNNPEDFDWKKISTLAKRFVILHSDNDPFIPPESIKYYRELLPRATIKLFYGKQHFSESTGGVKELPEILSYFIKQSPINVAVNYKMRDWLFSRQRYWGEPIPIIHCDTCGNVAVPEKELPLELPDIKKYKPTGTGESPLAAIESWVNTTCPKCKKPGKRETNTMPQWAGSNWYFLRYTDPQNAKVLADKNRMKEWLPVDMYIGGAEHAVLHLLYARFIYKFLSDIDAVPKVKNDEPFSALKNQGLILGEDMQKMSKSRGNVVSPDEVIEEYGADVMRMYEMFMGPFEDSKPWSMNGMVGIQRFLEKVIQFAKIIRDQEPPETTQKLHATIKKVSKDIETFNFNTAISSLMEFVNVGRSGQSVTQDSFKSFLILLSPFAPHLTEEIWQQLHDVSASDFSKEKSVTVQLWPKYDESKLDEYLFTLVVMINGKPRDTFEVSKDANEKKIKQLVFERSNVKKWIEGKKLTMEKYVLHKIYTIVVK